MESIRSVLSPGEWPFHTFNFGAFDDGIVLCLDETLQLIIQSAINAGFVQRLFTKLKTAPTSDWQGTQPGTRQHD